MFFLITSCHRFRERRETVRLTWLKRLAQDVRYAFVVGDGPAPIEPDVVQVDAPDDYARLALKVRAAYRYALQFRWSWLFKCDEDTYLVPERLVLAFSTATLGPVYPVVSGATRDVRPGEPCWIGAASYAQSECLAHGGAGYLLSRPMVERLAGVEVPDEFLSSEDGWVGKWMRRWSRLYVTPLLYHLDDRWPTPSNRMVSCHGLNTPDMMFRAHARYVCATPIPPVL